METNLKTLLEELVADSTEESAPEAALPTADVLELDSEEAWNDFQDSQIAYEKAFEDSRQPDIDPK